MKATKWPPFAKSSRGREVMTRASAYLNGQFVPVDQIRLGLDDLGFLTGATVADRVRTYGGQPFRLRDHVERFVRSCESCRVPLTASIDDLDGIAQTTIASNRAIFRGRDFMVIMFATPGNRGLPTLCVHTSELDTDHYRPVTTNGARLVVPPTRHLPAECVPPSAKMRSRMFWWIAEQQVREVDPDASALLLDLNGHVTETALANFLIVRDGDVISPPRSTVLPGVSLQVVEELCHSLAIPFREQMLTLPDCLTADEALLTSTPFGVAGVSSINGRAIPWPGPILRRLHDAWSNLVGVDIWKGLLPTA